jgi:hypothetical protein
MSCHDEATTLRRRMDALEAAVASMARRSDCGGTAIVLKVQAAPAAAQKFVSVKAVTLDGTEVEGATVTLTEAGGAFTAANVGTKKPPADTILVGELLGGLWVVQYDGAE